MEPQNPNSNKNLEQKEVENYIKFFTLKSLQCVIDSRTGCCSNTRCNPTAKGLDWFNISLPDSDANRKFQSTIRELFGKKIPGMFKPVCLDIVLKTSEGTFTVLESWQVSTNSSVQENIKNIFSIYNRLGVLLKSVITISRVLPSYQLSRKNDSDFLLFFKVHSEIYPLHHYELHNIMPIGSVVTPIGEISIKALYRNKIWLTAGSMHSLTYVINDTSALFPLSADKEKPFRSLDVYAENEIALAVSDISPCLPDWFSLSSSGSSEVSSAFKNVEKQSTSADKQITQPLNVLDETVERPVAAFAEPFAIDLRNMPNLDLPELPATPPFLSLLQDSPDSKIISAFLQDSESTDTVTSASITNETENEENKSPILQRRAEAVGFEDDFVLVELRPAFCSDHDTVGSLFRQCQSPVALDMFAALEKEDRESETVDLDTQLEKYRKELQEFENYFQVIY